MNKIIKIGSNTDFLTVLLFGIGMLSVYVSSTLFHAVHTHPLKDRMQIFDHVSIYLLIGGTYLPIVWKYTDAYTATFFTVIQWTIILLGTFFKLFFTGKHEKVSLLVYLMLGWSVMFLIKPLYAHMSFTVFKWILIGGLSYTTGVIFYRMENQKYAHSVWHLFVLGGSISHYIAISEMYSN